MYARAIDFLLSLDIVVTRDQDLLAIETLLPVRVLTAGEALMEVGFCYE